MKLESLVKEKTNRIIMLQLNTCILNFWRKGISYSNNSLINKRHKGNLKNRIIRRNNKSKRYK